MLRCFYVGLELTQQPKGRFSFAGEGKHCNSPFYSGCEKEKKKKKNTENTSGSDTSQQELTLFLSTKTAGMGEASEERLNACCLACTAAAEIVPWDVPAKLHLGWAVSGDGMLRYVPCGVGESSEDGGREGDGALQAPGLWPRCEGSGSAAF